MQFSTLFIHIICEAVTYYNYTISEKCHTVYNFQCRNCRVSYIGETKCPLTVKASEHKREPFPIAEHAKATGHSILAKDVKILDSDLLWLVWCIIRQAACIRKYRNSGNGDGAQFPGGHSPHDWLRTRVHRRRRKG